MREPSEAGEPKRKANIMKGESYFDVIGRISPIRYCRYIPMASREFTPSEYHTNVSSLSFEAAGTDTMNKELQIVRL